ncbi:MAG TPA: hypothetical protein PKN85_06530 [Syntrophorhabdaceae bacterium]|nr:hypothetical protein [Syntrophorhabdaceae bacterium]HOD75371.1 hypothetical protein [Syntrophorhabdaceae bacterium]
MRERCMIGTVAVLGLSLAVSGMWLAQSSRCVILEKEGSRVLVSCNGKPARYIDLGGRADMYRVGDSIDDRTFPGASDRKVKEK